MFAAKPFPSVIVFDIIYDKQASKIQVCWWSKIELEMKQELGLPFNVSSALKTLKNNIE